MMTTTETSTCTYCNGAGCGDCCFLDLPKAREPKPSRTYPPVASRTRYAPPTSPNPQTAKRPTVDAKDGTLSFPGEFLAVRLTAEQERAFTASWGKLPSDTCSWQEPDGTRYWVFTFTDPWSGVILAHLGELLTEGSSWSDGDAWLVAAEEDRLILPYSDRERPATTQVRALPRRVQEALYELAYANDLANRRRINEERDENTEPILPRPPWWSSTEDRKEPRLLSADELATLAPEPRVHGIGLGQGDVAALYGPTNVGKTFVALGLALSIATGEDWHGHETRQGNVLYLAAEGNKAALGQRVQAWGHQHDREAGANFRVSDLVEDFTDVRSADEVYRRLLRDFWLPDVIVLDTVSAAIGMGDENNSRTAQGLMSTCRRLMRLTGSSILLVHHTGKNASNGMRGHSALLGGVETSVSVSSRRGGLELEVQKQRDRAKLAEPIRLRLEAAGDSAVIVPASARASEPVQQAPEEECHAVAAVLAAAGGEVLGKNHLLALIGGRKQTATSALNEALESGVVTVDTSARPHAYRLV